MQIFLGIVGIVLSFLLLKNREAAGNMIGDPDWANKVGGIYNVIIIFAVLLFFWSVSYMTGTIEIFLMPLLWLIPGVNTRVG